MNCRMSKLLQNIILGGTFVSMVAGGTLWLDSRFDAGDDRDEVIITSVDSIKQALDYAGWERAFLLEDAETIKDSLEDIKEAQTKDHESMVTLATLVRNQNDFSKAQMKILLDDWLKKNFSLNESSEDGWRTPLSHQEACLSASSK